MYKVLLTRLLFFCTFILTTHISTAQSVFQEFVDSIYIGFEPNGVEFIADDIWMVDKDKLIQFSFPDLVEKNRYHIPIGLMLASDITSDGSDFIWLGEGRGSPFGYLHTFDIKQGRFIDRVKLNTEGFYQIQGLDYHEGKLWISNWNQLDFTVLISDLHGNVEAELDLERKPLLPIALDNNIMITGNSDFLFAFEKDIVGLLDFLVFQTIESISGVADIYDGKFWFSRFNGQNKIYSIALKKLTVSTTEEVTNKDITVSPNPSSDIISVDTEMELSGFKGFVIDDQGRMLISQIRNFSRIDIRGIVPGVYTLLLIDKNHQKIYNLKFAKI